MRFMALPRTVIAKAECHDGRNQPALRRHQSPPRASAPPDDGRRDYDDYVQRGESEHRMDELKNGVHMDRLSCHRFMANFFRLILPRRGDESAGGVASERAASTSAASRPALHLANDADQSGGDHRADHPDESWSKSRPTGPGGPCTRRWPRDPSSFKPIPALFLPSS